MNKHKQMQQVIDKYLQAVLPMPKPIAKEEFAETDWESHGWNDCIEQIKKNAENIKKYL